MAELLSIADVSAIPPSMDPIYTGQSAPLALTAEGIRAILRRAKSAGYQSSSGASRGSVTPDEDDDKNEHARARTNSPTRANSKRRRSAAPITYTEIRHRSLSGASVGTPSPSLCSELGLYDRNNSSSGISHPSIQYGAASDERSPSRGRTWRREDTPHPGIIRRDRNRQDDERSNISRRRQYRHSEATPEQVGYSPPSSEADDLVLSASSYVTKGEFRLHNYQEPGEFRFPKSRSQPESIWKTGDGFSDDEARPQFVFPMTRKRKRRRSRSLSAFGQLSLYTEAALEHNPEEPTSTRSHLKESYRLWGRVGEMMKDLWPTRENFMEPSVAKKPRNIVTENYSTIESAPPFNPIFSSMSTPKVKQTVQRKRQASDFENFGKRGLRSQSRHRKRLSSSSTRVQQVNRFQIGDEKHEKEKNGVYERVRDENLQQSMVNNLEASEYDSEELDEEDMDELENSDDVDEYMKNTTPDSQLDEFFLTSCDIGERPMSTSS
ncbi:hypothetical protein F5Y12DRAFT_790776 [Xylaria sp. FL1777]|nr:hypothetical protein F5Y12DRAFT_790776 [Xylaria sp. FL1777]